MNSYAERQLRRAARNQQRNAGGQSRERNPLRVGKPEVQALLVEAEELDDEARDRIEREIPAENRARQCAFCRSGNTGKRKSAASAKDS